MKTCAWYMVFVLALFVNPVSADQWVIKDNFIGGGFGPVQDQWVQKEGDVISFDTEINNFDVDQMIVDIDDSGLVNISIQTDYEPFRGTDYGDLFISTNGWNPFGEAPYLKDVYRKGEDWEFAFDTSLNSIYKIGDVRIRTSNYVHGDPNDQYRNSQEVLIDPKKKATPVSGVVSGYDAKFSNDTIGILTYSFSLRDLGIPMDEGYNLGFRWSMTCANDIIEGGVFKAAVPEPATLMMLGMGLLGLSAAARKKR